MQQFMEKYREQSKYPPAEPGDLPYWFRLKPAPLTGFGK